MKLSIEQINAYHKNGFITIDCIFKTSEMDQATQEAHRWQEQFIKDISEADKKWYLDGGTTRPNQVRKLDNPVSQRQLFRKMAQAPKLIAIVEEIIGKDVVAFFSQIFFKPPHGGGPKPAHQDNFYFGPDKGDHIITVWIAFDDALIENGCLYYGIGSNRSEIITHHTPENEPFNYQIPDSKKVPMTAAPVRKGGINLHHGNTIHQSSNNTSSLWRRAMAIHYMQKGVNLINPIFEYNPVHFVAVN